MINTMLAKKCENSRASASVQQQVTDRTMHNASLLTTKYKKIPGKKFWNSGKKDKKFRNCNIGSELESICRKSLLNQIKYCIYCAPNSWPGSWPTLSAAHIICRKTQMSASIVKTSFKCVQCWSLNYWHEADRCYLDGVVNISFDNNNIHLSEVSNMQNVTFRHFFCICIVWNTRCFVSVNYQYLHIHIKSIICLWHDAHLNLTLV